MVRDGRVEEVGPMDYDEYVHKLIEGHQLELGMGVMMNNENLIFK